jgi:hypothetical protein
MAFDVPVAALDIIVLIVLINTLELRRLSILSNGGQNTGGSGGGQPRRKRFEY